MKYQKSEKTTVWNERIERLKWTISRCKTKKDIPLKIRSQNEIDELIEKIIIEENSVNPLITYKCKKCGVESILPETRKTKKCLNCRKILLGE